MAAESEVSKVSKCLKCRVTCGYGAYSRRRNNSDSKGSRKKNFVEYTALFIKYRILASKIRKRMKTT